jgi:DNA-binding transcriptional LysR family regulator
MTVSVHGRFRENTAEAVHRAALNGIGVALLSYLVALEDIREGRLQSLMPDFPPLSFPLSIVYPRGAISRPARGS